MSKYDKMRQVCNDWDTLQDAIHTYIQKKVEPRVTWVASIAVYDHREAILVHYEYNIHGIEHEDDCTILVEDLDWE